MTIQISQPDGAGTPDPGDTIEHAWMGQEITISLPSGAYYSHEIVYQPEGSSVTISGEASQTCTITPGAGLENKSIRITSKYKPQKYMAWVGYTRVIGFTRDENGAEIGMGLRAPALHEAVADLARPESYGYVRTWEENIARLVASRDALADDLAALAASVASLAGTVSGLGDVAPTADTLALRGSEAEIKASRFEGFAITAGTAAAGVPTLPITLRGQQAHADDLGDWPTANVFFDGGFAGVSTSGEAAMINFGYGDARAGHPEGAWIASEIGHYGTPMARTPTYFRIHTGTNPETGETISLMLRGSKNVNIAAAGEIQIELNTGKRAFMKSWAIASPSSANAGDGSGGHRVEVNRACKTVGVQTLTLFDSATLSATEAPAVTGLTIANCMLVCHELGGTREMYSFAFKWLGGYGDLGTYALAGDSMAGRVALVNDGAGRQKINVTGLSGQTMIWTLFMDLYREPHSL